MKTFAETGKIADELSISGQGENDVYDIFSAPAIPTGSGRTETQFIIDGNHSLVSKVIPIIGLLNFLFNQQVKLYFFVFLFSLRGNLIHTML